jgi:hypothetical protein
MTLRFKLPPGGDVPPIVAARRIGLSLDAFRDVLPRLIARGFPPADPTTGNFDLDAIDEWRRRRFPHLYPLREDLRGRLTSPATARDAKDVVHERVARLRSG